VDIAGATSDPDAFELERRTIQSLYLMRSQEAGSVPPQESALLYNSWTGKHHSEMRWVGVCFVAWLHVFFLVLFDTSASLGCVWREIFLGCVFFPPFVLVEIAVELFQKGVSPLCVLNIVVFILPLT
jgi:hypothetical protein